MSWAQSPRAFKALQNENSYNFPWEYLQVIRCYDVVSNFLIFEPIIENNVFKNSFPNYFTHFWDFHQQWAKGHGQVD